MLFLGFISSKQIIFPRKWAETSQSPGSLTSTQCKQISVGGNCSKDLLTGFLLVNLDFFRFLSIFLDFFFNTRNEAKEQHSLLHTIFDYIFYFGPPGKYLYLSPQNLLHVGRRSRPTCRKF